MHAFLNVREACMREYIIKLAMDMSNASSRVAINRRVN